jgi:hypothetical protein
VRNLLLITESFPPVNVIAAMRFPPMLSVLESNGWQTWVITQNSSGPLPVGVPEKRIIRIGRHPQEGIRTHDGGRFLIGRSRSSKAAHRAMKRVGLNLAAAGGSLLSWYWPILRQLSTLRKRLPRPDIIIGTSAPSAPLWLARRLAALYGCPWIADYRDLGALRPYGRPSLVQGLDRILEAFLLKTAAAATTPSERWAAMLARQYGIETRAIYNGWDDSNQLAPKSNEPVHPGEAVLAILKDNRPWLYYAGLLRPRQMEGILRILRAIAGTDFRLVVRSLGPTELEEQILPYAVGLGIEESVIMLPPVSYHIVCAEARLATANLVLEDVRPSEEWSKGHLSGKFLQLLPLEPPIIFMAQQDTEAAEVLAQTGKGTVCTNISDVEEQLRQLEAGSVAKGDPTAVFEFSKTRQAEKLLELIELVHAQGVQRRTSNMTLS